MWGELSKLRKAAAMNIKVSVELPDSEVEKGNVEIRYLTQVILSNKRKYISFFI